MFYSYRQNNSGGFFITDENAGLGPRVLIEASSAHEANDRAKTIGIYFDGCDSGEDCECCGDRWDRAWETDGVNVIQVDVDWDFLWHDRVYVHLKDGSILRLSENPEDGDLPCRD